MTALDRAPIERLLVATDGEPDSDAALRVAKQLAARDGSQVEVVGVFRPRIPIPPPTSGRAVPRFERRDRAAVSALRQRIEHQLRDRIGVSWRVSMCVGNPTACITKAALATRASLVVLGHTVPFGPGEHRPGPHTAEQVAIGCDNSVLVVPAGQDKLPRLVVSVDDGTALSRRARAIATALLADDGVLCDTDLPIGRGLLHYAEALGADLLSLPLHGNTPTIRLLMGGGVMDVLGHAHSAVLITPDNPESSLVVFETAAALVGHSGSNEWS